MERMDDVLYIPLSFNNLNLKTLGDEVSFLDRCSNCRVQYVGEAVVESVCVLSS